MFVPLVLENLPASDKTVFNVKKKTKTKQKPIYCFFIALKVPINSQIIFA